MEVWFARRYGAVAVLVSILVSLLSSLATGLQTQSTPHSQGDLFPRRRIFIPVFAGFAGVGGIHKALEPANIDFQYEATRLSVRDEAAAYTQSRSSLVPLPLLLPPLERHSRRCVLVRHGRTPSNVLKVCRGQAVDDPLDAVGLAQTLRAGLCLRDLKADVLFCSQLQRAAQTARAIGGANPHLLSLQRAEPTAMRELNEIGYGAFEGHVIAPGMCMASVASFVGGESPKQVSARAGRALGKLVASVAEGGVVVAASHGALLRVLLEHALEGTATPTLSNAGISVLDVGADGRVTCRVLNYAGHLE